MNPVDLVKLNAEIDAWVTRIVDMQSSAGGEVRPLLDAVLEKIRDSQQQFNAEYARVEAEIKENIDQATRSAQQTLRDVEDIRKRAADLEKQAAEPPPPIPAPQPIDRGRGEVLRQELIQRYWPKSAAAQTEQVIEDFSAEYQNDAYAAPTASVPTAAPQPMPDMSAEVAAGLLTLAGVASRDFVIHLGCGDGRLLISAASRFGTSGLGIDANAAAVKRAEENIRKGRLQSQVTVRAGNPRGLDCRQASIVVLSLGAQANEAVALELARYLTPGARILTHDGPFKTWPADAGTTVTDPQGQKWHLHLWRIPENQDSSLGSIRSVEWER